MFDMAIVIAVVLAIFLLWKMVRDTYQQSLPAPKGLPFLGILHKLDYGQMPQQLTELGREFTGLMYIGLNILVVGDRETANEILVKQDPSFADRHNGHQFFADVALGKDLVFCNYNDRLQKMRKAAFQALHLHGAGLRKLEAIIQEELEVFLDKILKKEGTDIAATQLIYGAVINMISSILLGENFSYDSEEVQAVQKLDQCFNRIAPLTAPEVNRFPWMLHLPFARYRHKKQQLQEYVAVRDYVMKTLVGKYMTSYDPANIACVLSSLLKTQEVEGPDVFTDDMIRGIMLDLIIAGSVTTSTSISGLVFVLAHKPEVQDRMYREIQAVVGDGRMPRAEDKESLPYVSAVILEILRYQSIVPLNVPRIAATSTTVNGHIIPKNTMLFINQWAIHHNPEQWERPYEFYPPHFLDG